MLDCLAGILSWQRHYIRRLMAREILFRSKQTPYFEEEESEYQIIGERVHPSSPLPSFSLISVTASNTRAQE